MNIVNVEKQPKVFKNVFQFWRYEKLHQQN